jgi:hypothetical protein
VSTYLRNERPTAQRDLLDAWGALPDRCA